MCTSRDAKADLEPGSDARRGPCPSPAPGRRSHRSRQDRSLRAPRSHSTTYLLSKSCKPPQIPPWSPAPRLPPAALARRLSKRAPWRLDCSRRRSSVPRRHAGHTGPLWPVLEGWRFRISTSLVNFPAPPPGPASKQGKFRSHRPGTSQVGKSPRVPSKPGEWDSHPHPASLNGGSVELSAWLVHPFSPASLHSPSKHTHTNKHTFHWDWKAKSLGLDSGVPCLPQCSVIGVGKKKANTSLWASVFPSATLTPTTRALWVASMHSWVRKI